MQKILGIDPGLQTVGFGVIESDGRVHKFVGGGVITTPSSEELPKRLATIYDNAVDLIAEFKPDIASIEKLFFLKNVTSGIQVAQAQGVLILACQKADLQIYEYTPLQIKMSLSGYGRATKEQVQLMVQQFLHLSKKPTPDDCADALAAALTFAFMVLA